MMREGLDEVCSLFKFVLYDELGLFGIGRFDNSCLLNGWLYFKMSGFNSNENFFFFEYPKQLKTDLTYVSAPSLCINSTTYRPSNSPPPATFSFPSFSFPRHPLAPHSLPSPRFVLPAPRPYPSPSRPSAQHPASPASYP